MNDVLATVSRNKHDEDLSADDVFQIIIEHLYLVASKSDIDEQMMLLADLGRVITKSDRCTVWFHDLERNTLWAKIAHGIDRIHVPETKGIVGAAFSTGEDIIINDAYSDARFSKNTDIKTGYHTKNIIALPLRDSKSNVIGVFQAINKLSVDEIYSPLDVQRAFLVASFVGRMLETCVLYNEIRKSKEELKDSKEMLKNILEATNDGFWDWNIANSNLFVSPAWVKFVSGSQENISFNALARMRVHKDDIDMVEAVFGEQLSPDCDAYEIEYRLTTFDNKPIWVEERGRVMEWSGDGMVSRIVGTFKDISQRKQAQHEREKIEAQLQHVQRLESLGIMAGGVAHDYNNMLATIIGNAELAVLDLPTDSDSIEYLEQIQKAAYRSSELTRQLLNYSGGGKFVIEKICLNSMITETLELVKASLSKKAKLTLSLSSNLPKMEGDISQIRQVLMNLIINASDSLGTNQGNVSISTTVGVLDPECHWLHSTETILELSKQKFVSITVSDTGSGIEKDCLEKIFEPFFSTKTTGRGLGLASVIGIIKSHRGGITVRSEVGVGTEFLVQIPIAVADVQENSIDDENSNNTPKHTNTIIIADDEEGLLLIMTKTLQKEGYKVLSASNGKAALALYVSNRDVVDILILDNNMPEMSGPEVLAEIRKLDENIPVILVSGFSESPLAHQTEMKNTEFLSKPFARNKMLKAIDALITKRDLFTLQNQKKHNQMQMEN